MKKTLILVSILLFTQFLLCQNKKEIIFMNVNDEVITRKEFKSFDKKRSYITEIENDTALIKKVSSRKQLGLLDSVKHRQVKIILSKIIGSEFNGNKNIMIHLYDSNTAKIKDDIENERYWSWIKKNSHKFQSYLIGTKNSKINVDSENHLFLDQYDILKNLFFRNSKFLINHLFIKPNGEVFIYNGEEDILFILDWSV